MSYNYRIQNDNPKYFFPLSSGSDSFTDFSTGQIAQINGSPLASPSLVVGGGNAYRMDGSNNMRFESNIFNGDPVMYPFTIESWFKGVNVTERKGIVGHLGNTDGLTFDGEAIYFSTDHGTAGIAEAKYYPRNPDVAFYVAGVHTNSRNELYVNGVLVSSVDLTEDQINSSYLVSSAPGYIYCGHLPGSIVIDAPAVYNTALSSRTLKLHFLWGRDAPGFKSVVSSNNGHYWNLVDDNASVVYDFSQSWESGQSASVTTNNLTLSPMIGEDGLTVESTWVNGFIMESIADSVAGSKIEWQGHGEFLVETSISEFVWDTATNRGPVTGIYEGLLTANRALEVRVTFPGGQPEIPELYSLSIKLYDETDSQAEESGLAIDWTGKPTFSSEDRQIIEFNDKMGGNLKEAYGIIPAHSFRAVELFFKTNGAVPDNRYVFDSRSAGNTARPYLRKTSGSWNVNSGSVVYVNGNLVTLSSGAIPAGVILENQFNHVVVSVASEINAELIINNDYNSSSSQIDMQIGLLSTYADLPSSNLLYSQHLGADVLSISDLGQVTLSDSPETVNAYSLTWSVVGSG